MASVSELRARGIEADQFLFDAYEEVASPPGKGLPHAHAVADILRDGGADELTQLVGRLHDVVEDTSRTVDEVRASFGEEVADLVAVLTEDRRVANYAARKRLLRSRIAAAGSPAVDVALADKIATLQFALLTGTPPARRKLRHYRATLRLAQAAGVADELCVWVADLLSRVGQRATSEAV